MTNRNIRDVVPPAQEIEAEEGPLSPASILREQAKSWTHRTNQEIVAEVEPARASSDRLAYWFSFVVPALDGYRYRLFRVEHGIDFYPLQIDQSRTGSGLTPVPDEEALYDELQRIFASPFTLSVVRQLRSLVAEQRAARDAG
jgi:hypothetical protein